jgi:dsRNA-specific ribonuclease
MANITQSVYLGSRGADFKHMIMRLLQRGKLKPKYIEKLTDQKGMEAYGHAFTARTADAINNYERFEQIGDVTANKFIVWYAYRRFPQLDCTDGVKVVARLRINYGAKQFFGPLGEQLGFWPFISAAEEGVERNQYYRNRNKKDLLEDCVESFVGCTEYLLDKAFRPGVGYGIVYDILANIFDDIHMSLKYEDLYDAKTRLKETFDAYKELGGWYFHDTREDVEDGYTMANAVLYQMPPEGPQQPLKKKIGPGRKDFELLPYREWVQIGTGIASKKGDAQQKAAEQGIKTLRRMGFFKDPPDCYLYFCKSE